MNTYTDDKIIIDSNSFLSDQFLQDTGYPITSGTFKARITFPRTIKVPYVGKLRILDLTDDGDGGLVIAGKRKFKLFHNSFIDYERGLWGFILNSNLSIGVKVEGSFLYPHCDG